MSLLSILMPCVILTRMIIATNTSLEEQYDVLPAAGAACFDAKNYTGSNFFHPPKNGTISGVRLTRINGTVRCGTGSQSDWSNWGCDYQNNYRLHMFILRVTDEAKWNGTMYYPTKNMTV